MILPGSLSNLKNNIMVLGADIIAMMSETAFKDRYVLVDEVLEKFLSEDKRRDSELFFYAVSFLYTLGSIEREGPSIKLVKHGLK